ncbi:hypothetical protein [Mycolicibacterium porcinum]|uniref:hypothetical protein n=1 Tax=Mycolicibacterium porcinum TaxID=39693 RepID=UPI0008488171|nr:hypothetical protein [Mycolicibacterium porcinum]
MAIRPEANWTVELSGSPSSISATHSGTGPVDGFVTVTLLPHVACGKVLLRFAFGYHGEDFLE